jgi:UPF0716 protein FxsA
MLLRLFLFFTVIPLVELYLLIRLGTYLGVLDTLAVVIATGIVGGLLARSQGLAVLNRIRMELSEGRIPAESLFDGVMILVAGILLITPGLLTDGLGLCLLIPWTRQVLKLWLQQRVQEQFTQGEIILEKNNRARFARRKTPRIEENKRTIEQ